jgi:hypothetical protein
MQSQLARKFIVGMSLLGSFAGGVAQQTGVGAAAPLGAHAPLAATAPTAVPALVPYSGAARDAKGQPLAGEASATFLVYKDQQGGEPLFAESQTVSFDDAGRYKVQLGASSPNGLPSDLFASGEARWLEVQIAGQPVEPRVLLASVPYALKAADAATLGGLPASAYALAAQVAASPAISPNAASAVTTTGGVAGYLAEFSGASTIVDSPLFVVGSDVGVGTQTPIATLDVNGSALVTGALAVNGGMSVTGSSTYNGPFALPAEGSATATSDSPSQVIKVNTSAYNSATKAVVSPRFELQAFVTGNNTATPGATLDVLASTTSAGAVPTGFSINTSGIVTFAPGQTFPGGNGSGTITGVTAGTGLTGGGTSGNVTLNVNTAQIASLAGNNTYTGSNVFVPSLYEETDVNIDINNANAGSVSPGLRFGNASGEGIASQRTAGGNQFGLDLYTGYQPRLSINSSGLVAIGTGATFDGSQLQVQGANNGVEGTSTSGGSGVVGTNANTTIGTAGVLGIAGQRNIFGFRNIAGAWGDSSASIGVLGTSDDGYGVAGSSNRNVGVSGYSNQSTGVYGVSIQNGVEGLSYGGNAVAGDGQYGGRLAGYFQGDVSVTGSLTASSKDFKIDHPSDPANKFLVHASIESSEMVNIYSGNVTTDELGLATVQLPDWFEAENGDFRYQLTSIGRDAHAWIAEEIHNRQFKIATNATFVKVSWQVTGVRQDAYAKAHPLVVEEAKPDSERGFYLRPELYGQPEEKQLEWARNPVWERAKKTMREAWKARAAGARPATTISKPIAAAAGAKLPASSARATAIPGAAATAQSTP